MIRCWSGHPQHSILSEILSARTGCRSLHRTIEASIYLRGLHRYSSWSVSERLRRMDLAAWANISQWRIVAGGKRGGLRTAG